MIDARKPEGERDENRSKLFELLLEKSYQFNELFNASGYSSKTTLNKHLMDLTEMGVIEKSIEDGKIAYRVNLNEEDIEEEFKKMHFDVLLDLTSKSNPELGLIIKLMMRGAIITRIFDLQRKVDGKGKATPEERKNHFKEKSWTKELSEHDKEMMKTEKYQNAMAEAFQFFKINDFSEDSS
jgi:DNA-binding transcriptional ArsR family regulator